VSEKAAVHPVSIKEIENLIVAKLSIRRARVRASGIADALADRFLQALNRYGNAAPAMAAALLDICQQYDATLLPVGADLADSINVFGRDALAKATGTRARRRPMRTKVQSVNQGVAS
jgi:hypothetical protein